jgi:hypothetical protein
VQYIVDRSGPLTNKRRTATGGFLVDAVLARTGVLEYSDGKGGIVRHFNPPEVLSENLDALLTSPVTNRHPKKMVDAVTYKDVVAGHVVGNPEFKDGKIFATLAIQDAQLIADIEMGAAREVSMGYLASNAEETGTCDGLEYQVVRKSIQWNHIAIVPAGRAGAQVCLMLDSVDIPQEEADMIKVNGKEVAADKVQAAVDALEMLLEQLRSQVTELETKVVQVEAEKVEATSDAAIEKLVQAKLTEREKAVKVQEKRAKVAKVYPAMQLDSKSDDVIEALFDTISAERAEVEALAPGAQGGPAAPESPEAVTDAAAPKKLSKREQMLADQRKKNGRA